MKDYTIKITSNKSNRYWEYQLSGNDAIKVGDYIKRLKTPAIKTERVTLERFF
tara:strand:- start:433 stop:591 length:159 start_codon:yes stop_codon:yes gene_type:complete